MSGSTVSVRSALRNCVGYEQLVSVEEPIVNVQKKSHVAVSANRDKCGAVSTSQKKINGET